MDCSPQKSLLGFKDSNLVSINGNRLSLFEAIVFLSVEVGKIDWTWLIQTDTKVLEVREDPAAAVIMDALRHFELATLESKALDLKQELEQKWAREGIAGRWGSTCHIMSDAALASSLVDVSGGVTCNISHTHYLPCKQGVNPKGDNKYT